MIVRELVTRLGFSVNDSQLTKYQRGTDNIKRSAEGAADAFRNMFLAFAGFSTLRSLANVADEMQSIEARIGMLAQTNGTAAESFDVVANRAINAKQSIQAYAGFYIKAGEATKKFITDQDELLKVVDGAAFGLAASGATAVLQGQAFFQLGQAIGSPTVQMEEMNTLIDAAPQLFAALGDAIVGEGKNFKELIGKGKITGKQLAEGLSIVAPYFEERMKKIPNNIGQAILRVQSKWAIFIQHLNRESMIVTKIANFISDSFDSIEASLNAFVERMGGAEQAIKVVAIAVTALLLPVMAKLALGFATFLASPLGLAIASLFLLGLAIEDVYQWMTGGESVIGRFLGVFEDFVAELNSGILGKIWGFITKVTAFFADIIPFDTIWTGIKMIFSGLLSVVTGVVQTILGIFEILIGILTADWEMVWQGVKDAIGGIGELLVGLGKILLGAFGLALTAIVTLFKGAFIALGAFIYETIWGNIKKAVSWLASVPGFGGSKPMTSSTVAGAASAPAGVPTSGGDRSITINQELPPGTPEQTQRAAREGTTQALAANPWDKMARQSAQLQ